MLGGQARELGEDYGQEDLTLMASLNMCIVLTATRKALRLGDAPLGGEPYSKGSSAPGGIHRRSQS